MIPSIINPLGISGEVTPLDENTKFLLFGPKGVQDIAFGKTIENYGLYSDGEYICARTGTSYAIIPANTLTSDVFVSNHDWTIEIEFFAPENWTSVVNNTRVLFGRGHVNPPFRFDVGVRTTNELFIGGVEDNVGFCVSGLNYYAFQHTSSGVNTVKLNSSEKTTDGVVGDLRTEDQPIFWDTHPTNNRYGYPFKIKYIRISNNLRIV